MKSLAALLVVYNAQNFIYSQLKMLEGVDKILVVLQKRSFPEYDNYANKKLDKTREIITRYFPQVEIVEYDFEPSTDDANYMPDAINFGLQRINTFDMVYLGWADAFYTKQDFKTLTDILRNGTDNAYCLDLSKDSIDYYGEWDFTHGLRDQKEMETLAVKPVYEFQHYFHLPIEKKLLTGITLHHFRNWKPWRGIPGAQRVTYGPYESAPQEIQDLLLEGRKVCGI